MKRIAISPRSDWEKKVEKYGLIWHTVNDQPYWNESAYYSFTAREIAEIETATKNMYTLFLEAGQKIVEDPEMMTFFGIPEYCHKAIQSAWDAEPPALNFGRFDFGYDGNNPPKLFEFNCDTPTSLLEASIIQWYWKEDLFPKLDQFNSIHEHLVAKWKDIRSYLPGQSLHFTSANDPAGEDSLTIAYLQDTARQAGLQTKQIMIDDIGWHNVNHVFVDLQNNPIKTLFKLYPWESLMNEAFGKNLIESLPTTLWIEPIWKMLWSNKAILPVLSSMYPDHPNLLGASYDRPSFGKFVKKPFLSREGANVEIFESHVSHFSTEGQYGEEGFVYQERYILPEMAPNTYPIIGSWVVDGEPCGMGIREDGLVTGNTARFVPHVMEG